MELRPVKPGRPAEHPGGASDIMTALLPRFAHSAAVLQREDGVDIAVFGGVNQTEDLNDVVLWTV